MAQLVLHNPQFLLSVLRSTHLLLQFTVSEEQVMDFVIVGIAVLVVAMVVGRCVGGTNASVVGIAVSSVPTTT